jgi:hypothetical protein
MSVQVSDVGLSVGGRHRESFWKEPRVRKALQYLDAWGTVVWHRAHGGVGFPSAELDLESSSCRRGAPSDMPGIFDAYMSVEQALVSKGNPKILRGLLQWIYPKEGSYARERGGDGFRPLVVKSMAREFGWSGARLNRVLEQAELDFVLYLARRV